MKLSDLVGGVASNAGKELLAGRSSNVVSSVQATLNGAIDKEIGKLTKKLPKGLRNVLNAMLTDDAVSAARNRPDPLMQVHWSVELPLGLESSYAEDITLTESHFTCSAPIRVNGALMFIAEEVTSSPITITFYEDRLMTVSTWLMRWRQLISPDGKTRGYPAKYQQTIVVYAQDVKGVKVGKFVLSGAWPSGPLTRTFADAGSDRVRLTQEFSVNRVEFIVEESAASGLLSKIPGVSTVFGAIGGLSKIAGQAMSLGSATLKFASSALKF